MEIEKLSFAYRSPLTGERAVLFDLDLILRPGEIVALTGPTGSGKTTFLQHLNGLLRPESGRVVIDGCDLSSPDTDLQAVRSRIGVVFQFPENQLFEETVFDDVAFGPKNLNLPRTEIEKRVWESLALVGLDHRRFGNLSPFHLSGGEKRRIAIAGVLAMNPEMLVLDEPTVDLDWKSAERVERIVLDLNRRNRIVLFVTHDMDLIGRLADRILVLDNGRFVFDGKKSELFQNDVLLDRTGLQRPAVCRFMTDLKKRGKPVRTDVYTVKDAMEELKRVVGQVE